MKIINEKHTESMAICRNLATTVQCRLDAIDAQIQANKQLLNKIESYLKAAEAEKQQVGLPKFKYIIMNTETEKDIGYEPYYKYYHLKLVKRKRNGKLTSLCKCLIYPFRKLKSKFTNSNK